MSSTTSGGAPRPGSVTAPGPFSRSASRGAGAPPILAAAFAAVRAGLSLTPLRGKRPFRSGWQCEANTIRSEPEARAHYARHPSDGLGLVHEHSGTCVLDVDAPDAAGALLAARGLDLAALLVAGARVAGSPGRAKALFRWPGGGSPPRTARVLAPGGGVAFELRGSGGQDALPPSPHPSGGRYAWVGAEPDLARLPDLPAALAALWRELLGAQSPTARPSQAALRSPGPCRERVDAQALLLHGAPQGARNSLIFRACSALRAVGADERALASFALLVASRCRPPLDRREALQCARSAARYPQGTSA